jgi:hypothetical protein
VHHLVLGGWRYGKKTGLWMDKALQRFTVLTAIESLSIGCYQFERLDDVAITFFLSSFSRLKSLQLGHCSFFSSYQLSIALSATEHLERLGFHCARQGSKSFSTFPARLRNLASTTKGHGANVPSLRLPNHLQNLEITYGSHFIKEIVGCLQYGDVISTVHTLRLCIDDKNRIPAYSTLMHMVGPSLKTLTIDIKSSSFNPGMHPLSSHSWVTHNWHLQTSTPTLILNRLIAFASATVLLTWSIKMQPRQYFSWLK